MTRALPPIEPATMTYNELLRERQFLQSLDDGARNVRLAIVPTFRAYWFNKKHFGMYSKLGAGILVTVGENCNLDDSRVHFTCYGAPIAMEAGNHFVRGYLELSLGLESGVKFNIPDRKTKSR